MLGLARGALTARYLTPDGFGLLGLVNVILTYGALANLGLKPAAHREILQAQGRGDAAGRGEVQDNAITVTSLLAVTAAVVVAAYAAFTTSGAVQLAVLTGSVLIVLANVYGWLESGAWMAQRFSTVAGLQLATAAVSCVLAVGGAMWFGLGGVLVALVVTQLAMIVIAARVIALPYAPRLSAGVLRRLWRAGLPMFLGALALVALRNTDYLLVVGLLGRQEWGHYALALLVVSFLINAATDYARAAYPAMQERFGATGRAAALEPHVDGAVRLLAVAGAVVTGALIVTVHVPITLWLPDYLDAVALIHVLLVGCVFQAVAWPADLCLTAVGRQYVCLWLRVGAIVANVTAGCLFVWLGYGALGAAGASALASAAYAVSTLAMAGWALHGRVTVRVVRRAVAPLAYVAVAVLALVVSGAYRSPDVTVVALAAVSYGVYVTPLFVRRNGGRFTWALDARDGERNA